MNRKRNIAAGLFNYIVSVALVTVFALYMDGSIGWFLLAAFLFAPIISLLLTLCFVRRVYVTAQADAGTVGKGDTIEVAVTVGNAMFLPSPPVSVKLRKNVHAVCEKSSYDVSVMPLSEESFIASYTAQICGPCVLGVEDIRVTDYFGIFSFKPKNADVNTMSTTADIIPDITQVSFNNALYRQASELTAFADDSEDTIADSSTMFGGFPGYDHREYVPGDPLKRINWKLSAKRNMLLVRKDDEKSASSVSVVIDPVFDPDKAKIQYFHNSKNLMGNTREELFALACQWAVETALGLIRNFITENYTVTLTCYRDTGFEVVNIVDENDIAMVQTYLASYKYTSSDVPRIPSDELVEQKGSVAVYCTPYLDEGLQAVIDASSGTGKDTLVAAAVSVPGLDKGEEAVI